MGFEVFKSLLLICVTDFTFNWDLNQGKRAVLDACIRVSQ